MASTNNRMNSARSFAPQFRLILAAGGAFAATLLARPALAQDEPPPLDPVIRELSELKDSPASTEAARDQLISELERLEDESRSLEAERLGAREELERTRALLADLRAAAAPDAGPVTEDVRFYLDHVKPIFETNCYKCHGGGERLKANFDITTRAGLIAGGDRGTAFNSEDPDASLLLAMISYRDGEHEMPPSGKLSGEEIDAITRWVRMGTPFDAASMTKSPAAAEGDGAPHGDSFEARIEAGRSHRFFQPLLRPAVPGADNPARGTNPVDSFILARLDEKGLEPNPEAPPRTLIRRAYYDLTGLPPDPAEVEAFVADKSPDAWPKLIERLLASPHYGEKWGRHWLDVVRYAETNGYERDGDKSFIWRYRDYVIDSFNADKPYDRFIIEQLAGDELPDAGPEQKIATGFLRLGIWDDEPADKAQGRYDSLDDLVSTTSQAFLGVTLGCARCHDHKLDPLSQRDYYSMVSFFSNVKEMDYFEGRPPLERFNTVASVLTDAEQAEFDRKTAEKRDEEQRILGEMRAIERKFLLGWEKREQPDLSELRYRFYRDSWQSLPDFDELRAEDTGEIPHNFLTLTPATRKNHFGFVFEGRLHVPADGEYTFHIKTDDGSRLVINGEKIDEIKVPGLHEREAKAALKAGIADLRLDWFDKGGETVLDVAWSGPGVEGRPLSVVGVEDNPAHIANLIRDHGKKHLNLKEMVYYKRYQGELKEVRDRVIEGRWGSIVKENGTEAPETFLLIRGNPHVPGEKVEPAFPFILTGAKPEIEPRPEAGKEGSSGRRLALARWLASPENPLTARVMANRIWQHHFGRGLAPSPNDLGLAGLPATHPDLLDWLAAEFVDGGWSVKELHRRIMNSSAYRMSSRGSERALAADPANELYWRFDMRRLTGEEIRDSILRVTGLLNPKSGGPSVFPKVPEIVLSTSSKPDQVWGKSPEDERNRRSVYAKVKRSLLLPILQDYDLADTDSSCPVRFVTTQPTQALGMMNSEFVHAQAGAFAVRLRSEAKSPKEQVRLAFELVTARPASEEEVKRGVKFIREMERAEKLDAETALERFCLLALNLNEFVFVD